MKKLVSVLLLSLYLHPLSATVFRFSGAESSVDVRYKYVQNVLLLALEKTKSDYGDYQLQSATQGINIGRVIRQLEQGIHDNLFVRVSINDEASDNFHVVPFPISRGLTGNRIALVHKQNKNILCNPNHDKLLRTLTSIQGVGWLDIDILNANGVNVFPITDYERMFHMIERQRADLFFRSFEEIKVEHATHVKTFPSLSIETCTVLHYPLPRFLVTHKSNATNAKRIEIGLVRAYEDGSFIKLWSNHFSEHLHLLKGRKVIQLENPYLKKVNQRFPHYKKYNVTP